MKKAGMKIGTGLWICALIFFAPGCFAKNDYWVAQPHTKNRQAYNSYCIGWRLANTGKVRDSLGHFDQAIKLDPQFAEAHFGRGSALLELDRLNEAYGDFTKTIQLEPKHYMAYDRRARLNYEKGNVAEAIADYSSAVRAAEDPEERAEILKLRSKMYSTLKKYDLAINDLTQSLAIKRNANAFLYRGNLYARLKNYKKAIDDYSQGIAIDNSKNIDRLYTLRACAYEKIGRFDLAKKDKLKAKAKVENSWGVLLQDIDKRNGL